MTKRLAFWFLHRILADVYLLFWTERRCRQHNTASHPTILDVHLDGPWDAGFSSCAVHCPNKRGNLRSSRCYRRSSCFRTILKTQKPDKGKDDTVCHLLVCCPENSCTNLTLTIVVRAPLISLRWAKVFVGHDTSTEMSGLPTTRKLARPVNIRA
jgi:hypothetical protein